MAIKTFNIDEKVYKKFSEFCKNKGISMSKQVETFIRAQMSEKSEEREGHLKNLDMTKKLVENK